MASNEIEIFHRDSAGRSPSYAPWIYEEDLRLGRMELTRFRGPFILLGEEKGVHDAEDTTSAPSRVPAAGGGVGRTWRGQIDLAREFESRMGAVARPIFNTTKS
jgi:hypothetical protein